jgi:hypothetical protein
MTRRKAAPKFGVDDAVRFIGTDTALTIRPEEQEKVYAPWKEVPRYMCLAQANGFTRSAISMMATCGLSRQARRLQVCV